MSEIKTLTDRNLNHDDPFAKYNDYWYKGHEEYGDKKHLRFYIFQTENKQVVLFEDSDGDGTGWELGFMLREDGEMKPFLHPSFNLNVTTRHFTTEATNEIIGEWLNLQTVKAGEKETVESIITVKTVYEKSWISSLLSNIFRG